MAGVFVHKGAKRFSIDDAFEEENDEAIKVYGSTTERSPLKPKNRVIISEDTIVCTDDQDQTSTNTTRLKFSDDDAISRVKYLINALVSTNKCIITGYVSLSRDSDSLIHDGRDGNYYTGILDSRICWNHPKIRENWKVVLAAVLLLIVGAGLIVMGLSVMFLPSSTNSQCVVFLIAGFICFVPGAYHVVYIFLAVKGTRGYDFYHLPLFN